MDMNGPGETGHASKENYERDGEKYEFPFRDKVMCGVCASVPPQDANIQMTSLR